MIYGILSTIAFILILPFWLILGVFKPKLTAGFIEKCGFYNKKELLNFQTSKLQCILFYGISVGEVIAMENLIKKTKQTFPEAKIAVMTGTPTGQEIAQKRLKETADFITYFPFDFPFCIKNMLNKLKPSAVFIMETELWPNFSYITNKKKIPTCIINARISDGTYKSYKKLSLFFRPVLQKYTGIYPQSKQDREKFVSIGANSETTKVMGNLKFDIKKPEINDLNFEKNPEHKILLAGSTHSGEDEIILDAFCSLKKEIPELKLIIASRHPERNETIFELMKKTGVNAAKQSEKADFTANEIILLDTMGELAKFYSVCDIAFIGGSFNNGGKCIGGHNPLEATIFNKPVISGPSIHNFKDIYAILTATDSAKIVNSSKELKESLYKLLTNNSFYQKASEDCEKAFSENKGALDFVIEVIKNLV